MSLLQLNDRGSEDELLSASDAATRVLSVAPVETCFVEGVYEKLASVYDVLFGPTLHAGRLEAIRRLSIRKGDRVLEVGVGTGINAVLYPRDCHVTGVDLSEPMLEKARNRIMRRGIDHIRLLQMDAAHLQFPDGSFDIVYAPYLINVVSDPVRVASEMKRVCRSGGRIVFLNHFLSTNPVLSRAERLISPFTVHIGFKADFDLGAFLAQTQLVPASIQKVNIPRVCSLVTCTKD